MLGLPTVTKFGFHVSTSCGLIPQNNTWTDDWITFFIENRMSYQIQLLNLMPVNNSRKRKVLEHYWPRLKPIIPKFFEGIDVKPSLLHGDFWLENVAQCDSNPVVFDPATFYGHHEFDIASSTLFDTFPRQFFKSYFKKIPQAKGFEERMRLYHLYHYLSHWNQFGGGYTAVHSFHELLGDDDDDYDD